MNAEAVLADPTSNELVSHVLGATLAQGQVVVWLTSVRGVTQDTDHDPLGMGSDQLGHLLEDTDRRGSGSPLVALEENPPADSTKLGESRREDVGAAVAIEETVVHLRLTRTLVVDVEDLISIVVQIGTAVFIFEKIEILGHVRALVQLIDEPISITIARILGTAVFIAVTVDVLGLDRASVVPVEDSISVIVVFRASVTITEPINVLGLVWAAIDSIREAVIVPICWRTPLCSKEPNDGDTDLHQAPTSANPIALRKDIGVTKKGPEPEKGDEREIETSPCLDAAADEVTREHGVAAKREPEPSQSQPGQGPGAEGYAHGVVGTGFDVVMLLSWKEQGAPTGHDTEIGDGTKLVVKAKTGTVCLLRCAGSE